ncbi:MAG: hypothetical protein JWP45_3502 [Mucilaginibacter sp.]|nr:hypothetical protein [Mucilaginibacter sp.]
MDDPLDKELKNRIKEVFDNFGDTAADEGWLELRKKFPEEQSKRRAAAWIWWGSAAAVLFLFLSIGIWVYNKTAVPEKLSAKPSKTFQSPQITAQNTHAAHQDTLSDVTPTKKGTLVNNTKSPGNKNTNNITHFQANRTAYLNPLPKAGKLAQKAGLSLMSNASVAQKQPFANNTSDSQKADITNNQGGQLTAKINSNTTSGDQEVVDQKPAATDNTNTADVNTIKVIPQPAAKSMASVFAEEKIKKPLKTTEEPKKEDKKVHFGIYAATYFNYAKGSSNQVNAGAGFSSDFVINKNLKLVTGVAIAQNTLNYNSSVPTAAAVAQDNFYPASVKAATYASSNSTGIAALPSFKNYNANLVGLDIPLNLKYEFNPNKGNTYIIAGLSSGTFINEAYTYQYNYPSFNTTASQQTVGQTTTKSFNSFYFAKTLNVAFGLGYPIGKNHVVVEPFLKYPLQGLGAQQIKFGAGGLNLKFNFQTSKNK